MIFDLVKDFADVLEAMPEGHPRRRILRLLDEAIRRDVHFIDRHPTTFFQCLWNTCWWYDCPDVVRFGSTGSAGGHSRRQDLHVHMEKWRIRKSEILSKVVFSRIEERRRILLRDFISPAARRGHKDTP